MAKTGVVGNVLEQAEGVAAAAWENTSTGVKTVVNEASAQASWRTFLGIEAPPDENVMKQQEDQALMADLDGYKQKLREIDKIQGKPTDEQALDEKVQKEIQKKRHRLFESLHRFKNTNKDTAEDLGVERQDAIAQQEQQQKQADAQNKAAEEQAIADRMNAPIESDSRQQAATRPHRKVNRNRMRRREHLKRQQSKAEIGANQSSIG